MEKKSFIKELGSKTWIANSLGLLAGLAYLIQSIYDAHYLDVVMDEGTYLVKGFLYVTGVYRPFQPYGPWTNKMPLAFTIPGLAQAVFGPGLRTGRYFAVFISVLMLFGLWLVTYRLRGGWWAAAIISVMALNAGNITIYSRALSQGISACMLVWVFVLVLGRERCLWQTTLGAILSTLLVLTRQNMLPVPFLVVLFIFWAYGRKSGISALIAVAVIFIGFHALYWPHILKIWLQYLPGFAENMVKDILANAGWKTTQSTSSWSTTYGFLTKAFVFYEGVRMNFFGTIGMLCAWLFWPRKKQWKNHLDFKISIFLSVLILLLGAIHFWASFIMDYCLYCYNGYLSFFMPGALLLIAISFPYWTKKNGWLSQAIAVLFVIITSVGIAYGSYQILDDLLVNIPVPRMQNMEILPGTTAIWVFLRNKFGWPYEALQQAIPASAGLIFAGFIMSAVILFYRFLYKREKTFSLDYAIMIAYLLLGTLFSPSKVLGGGKFADYCFSDVIVSHEAVGKHLSDLIPQGSLIYWQNNVSPLPLLYLPDRKLFPPQLNHWYSFRQGGDPDILYQNGFWNAELADRWIEEADFLLIEEKYVHSFEENGEFSMKSDELLPTGLPVVCRDRSQIHIFKRVE